MECTIKIKGVETTFASMEAFDSYIHEKYNTLYEYVHSDENFQLAKIFEIVKNAIVYPYIWFALTKSGIIIYYLNKFFKISV